MKRPLGQPVGPGYNTDPDDVLTTKQRLRDVGLYSPPRGEDVTPFPDRRMYDGLATLQRGMGKRATGEMRPGDDTDRALTALADRAGAGRGGAERGWAVRGGSGRTGGHRHRTSTVPARQTGKIADGMTRPAEVPLLPSNPNDPLSTATPGLGDPGFGMVIGGPGRMHGGDIPRAVGGLGGGAGIGAGLLGQDPSNGGAPEASGPNARRDGGFWGPPPTTAPPAITPGTIDPHAFNPFFGPAPDSVISEPMVPGLSMTPEEQAHEEECQEWARRQAAICHSISGNSRIPPEMQPHVRRTCFEYLDRMVARCFGGPMIVPDEDDLWTEDDYPGMSDF